MTNIQWSDNVLSNIIQTAIRDIPSNFNKAASWFLEDHSTKKQLKLSVNIKGKIETIEFSVQPQDNIAFQNSSNIAVFNQNGSSPAIQMLGPNKSVVSWQGLFYNSGRSATYEEKEKNKYQFDIVKQLESWQNKGYVVTMSFGPIILAAVVQSFNYNIRSFDLIQYSIQMIVDDDLTSKLPRLTQKEWANGSVKIDVLLGGKDSYLYKVYNNIDSITSTYRKAGDDIYTKTSNIMNNLGNVQRSYLDLALVPANRMVDIRDQISETRNVISSNTTAMNNNSQFSDFISRLHE